MNDCVGVCEFVKKVHLGPNNSRRIATFNLTKPATYDKKEDFPHAQPNVIFTRPTVLCLVPCVGKVSSHSRMPFCAHYTGNSNNNTVGIGYSVGV